MESIKEKWKKTFAIIFTGQLFSLISSSIVQYAIIWYLTFKTGSAWVLTIATIAGLLPQMILGPFIGVIVDRVDRKKVMIYADIAVAISSLALAILFFNNEPRFIVIYIALAIRSLGTAFHSPAMQASIPLLAPEDKIVKVTGINQTIMAVSFILSPVIAGIIYGIMPMYQIILLDVVGAIIGVCSIIFVSIPKLQKNEQEHEEKKIIHEIIDGMKAIKENKLILVLTIYMTVLVILYMPVGSLFSLITSNYFKLQPFHASIIEVGFAVGMFIGGATMTLWSGFKKKQYTILFSALIFSVGLLLSGLVPSSMTGYVLFIICSAIMGVTVPFFSGIYMVILQTTIKPELLGRVFAFVNSIMLLGTPVGLIISAPVAEAIGVQNLFVISGGLILIATCITYTFRTIKR